MFRYVHLENYKSLVNLTIDFTNKNNVPRKLVLIYGENGAGKSNLASSFYLLNDSIKTKSLKDRVTEILNNMDTSNPSLELKEVLNNFHFDMESIVNKNKTIGVNENMVLEFGFRLNDKDGIYIMEMDNSGIVFEKLEYVWNKRKSVFFKIEKTECKLNSYVFTDKTYKTDIEDLVEKYWGKHSLLSIIVSELDDKKDGYVQDRINHKLMDVINYFMLLSVNVKGSRSEKTHIGLSHKILMELDEGTIELGKEAELDKVEKIICDFFTKLYVDVKNVYYKRDIVDNSIKYQLIFQKEIYGRLIDIDFGLESTGTRNLLKILPFIISSMKGNTVIVDEFDAGIHDLLVENIVNNIYPFLSDQLIITTHNTVLLESEYAKESAFVFIINENGQKEVIPFSNFSGRIHPNINLRKRYLNGYYGGIPFSSDIDFDDLVELL